MISSKLIDERKHKLIANWYEKHYQMIDPIVYEIISTLKNRLYLPMHEKTTFFIDYETASDDIIEYMYHSSFLR